MNWSGRFLSFSAVLLFTGALAVILWGLSSNVSLDKQMVYSYGTALPIWFLTGVLYPHFFAPAKGGMRSGKAIAFIGFSIVLGFFIGTSLGDWYAGWSTLALLTLAPQKLAGLIILCVAVSLSFILFFQQKSRLQSAEKQATQAQLQLLQSQLEPHMLFNTLANLRALIAINPAQAQTMLDHLIDYLRATLGASRVSQHALALEFARIEDYLALMQIRMGARLRYSLDLPAELKECPFPALLLQPLVENAILHGLEPHPAGGEIVVTASAIKPHLQLRVSDTGLGVGEAMTYGFGLTQVQERLHNLYGREGSLEWAPQAPQGTIITLKLPLTLLSK